MEIWNLKDQQKLKSFDYDVLQQATTCTSDSNFLFLKCEEKELLKIDIHSLKGITKYKMDGQIKRALVSHDNKVIYISSR